MNIQKALVTGMAALLLCAPAAQAAPTQPAPAPAPAPSLPEPTGSDLDKGMAYFYQDRLDEAIASLDKALKSDPGNTLAMAYELHAYYRKKDIGTITTKIEQDSSSQGNDATAEAHLGMAYFLRGLAMPNMLDESLNEFKNSVKDDPRCAMGYTGLGMVYFQKRMMPRAKGYFVRALRINPHDVMALDRLGNIMLVDEKKPDEALELYQRITAELPSYPDGYYYVGSALYDLKKYDDALEPLARCRDLDPKGITQGFDAACLLGDTYLKLNRNKEAADAFDSALKIQPDSKYAALRKDKALHPEAKS